MSVNSASTGSTSLPHPLKHGTKVVFNIYVNKQIASLSTNISFDVPASFIVAPPSTARPAMVVDWQSKYLAEPTCDAIEEFLDNIGATEINVEPLMQLLKNPDAADQYMKFSFGGLSLVGGELVSLLMSAMTRDSPVRKVKITLRLSSIARAFISGLVRKVPKLALSPSDGTSSRASHRSHKSAPLTPHPMDPPKPKPRDEPRDPSEQTASRSSARRRSAAGAPTPDPDPGNSSASKKSRSKSRRSTGPRRSGRSRSRRPRSHASRASSSLSMHQSPAKGMGSPPEEIDIPLDPGVPGLTPIFRRRMGLQSQHKSRHDHTSVLRRPVVDRFATARASFAVGAPTPQHNNFTPGAPAQIPPDRDPPWDSHDHGPPSRHIPRTVNTVLHKRDSPQLVVGIDWQVFHQNPEEPALV